MNSKVLALILAVIVIGLLFYWYKGAVNELESRTKTYSSNELTFNYPANWKLKQSKNGKFPTVVLASTSGFLSSVSVPRTGGRIVIHQAFVAGVERPEDYLKELPYADQAKNKSLTVDDHPALETYNTASQTKWLETIVMGNPQTAQTIIQVYPADGAIAKQAYATLIESLKTNGPNFYDVNK